MEPSSLQQCLFGNNRLFGRNVKMGVWLRPYKIQYMPKDERKKNCREKARN